MSGNDHGNGKEGTRVGRNGREIILLGLLNIESVYDKEWMSKKEEIKKDIENKAVKLNQAFKDPFYFHEHFEFLSAEDYQYVKNNYIYSAILIFNPNIEKQKGGVAEKETSEGKEGTGVEGIQERNKGEESNKHGEGKEGKKEEGVGVLVLTCKKMQKTQMKYMLIKMLKREIRVESVVLKKKQGIPVALTKGKKNEDRDETDSKHIDRTNWENESGNIKGESKYNNTEKLTKLEKQEKHSELKYMDNKLDEYPPGVTKKPFDAKVNNFFNMTAYLYSNSNLLTNTSLMQREYGDDEWADKLRRKKKEKLDTERNFTQKGANSLHVTGTASPNKSGGGFINSFTSLFKTK